MFTVTLAAKLDESKNTNVKVMCLHPGVVGTDFNTGSKFLTFFRYLCCCFYTDCATGARTSLYLSRAQYGVLQSGSYYDSDTRIK
jgi:short-subunit dehydrogenase